MNDIALGLLAVAITIVVTLAGLSLLVRAGIKASQQKRRSE
ncbi:hypothetical protein [Sulfurivirga sp.]|nr:hypothetical protein [Sulfurivirga sp.]